MPATFRAPKKDPQAVVDYSIDWTPYMPTGDTISTSSVTAPSGITVDSFSDDSDATVTWFLSGGTDGEEYDILIQITTTGGRTDQRTVKVPVENK